jgi:protein-S-isoprenylcysteine O-methyltransferase Ste14
VIAFKTLVFTVIVPGTVTIYFPLLYMDAEMPATWGVMQWLGTAVLAIGVATYARCAWDFTFAGLGTPAPIDPPKKLVIGGLYRWSRNPMYVGVLSILLGEALLLQSLRHLLYATAVFSAFEAFIVFYEEPHLRQTFGEAYLRYCKAVPRWVAWK